MNRRFIATLTLILFISGPVYAQMCPASNTPPGVVPGISDGCTTVGLEYALPDIGYFRNTFTPSCDGHDKCLSTLGKTRNECAGNFLRDLKSACRSKYHPIWRPAEFIACTDTALRYYGAVRAIDAYAGEPTYGLAQREARNRSLKMKRDVENNVCATTPELTTLYSHNLISKVNTAFSSHVGRLPTIYEFFDAVHIVDPAGDQNAWIEAVNAYAASRQNVVIPSVNYTVTTPGVVMLSPTDIKGGDQYLWKLNNKTYTDRFVYFYYKHPEYNATWNIDGFVTVTNAYGERNMKLVHEVVAEQGSCAPQSGPNIHCQ